jgi:hypothetical protein
MAKRYIPKNVRRFEWLTYGSNAVYLASLPFRPEALVPDTVAPEEAMAALIGGWAYVIVVSALTLSWVWFAARRRKNWARWALVAFMALSLSLYFFVPASYFTAQPYGVGFDLVLTVIQIYALYLVFSGDAKDWFKHGAVPLGKEEAADTFA